MKKFKSILALAIFGTSLLGADARNVGPIVSDQSTTTNTVYGPVQGYRDGSIYTFKGIPYAKAE